MNHEREGGGEGRSEGGRSIVEEEEGGTTSDVAQKDENGIVRLPVVGGQHASDLLTLVDCLGTC